MDTEDKGQSFVGLCEETPTTSSEASTLSDEEKMAQLKASKNLDERQREFKEMLLERGVSYSTPIFCN